MEQKQAIQVLIQAVNVAQLKGAFNLQDAKMIALAVEAFTTEPQPAKEDAKEEPKEEAKSE
jgi:hypothetical protein